MTRDKENNPLSILIGVRTRGLILEKIYELFSAKNDTLRFIRVSVLSGCPKINRMA